MSIEIRSANLSSPADVQAVLEILDNYAREPVGGGAPLSEDVRQRLAPALQQQPQALVLLGCVNGRAVGLATCFQGFSTFAARPLLNVHDLAVLPEFRRRGVGRALLLAAERHARERGCCKLTLEVREDNVTARGLYAERGFRDFELAGASYRTLFLSKALV